MWSKHFLLHEVTHWKTATTYDKLCKHILVEHCSVLKMLSYTLLNSEIVEVGKISFLLHVYFLLHVVV